MYKFYTLFKQRTYRNFHEKCTHLHLHHQYHFSDVLIRIYVIPLHSLRSYKLKQPLHNRQTSKNNPIYRRIYQHNRLQSATDIYCIYIRVSDSLLINSSWLVIVIVAALLCDCFFEHMACRSVYSGTGNESRATRSHTGRSARHRI